VTDFTPYELPRLILLTPDGEVKVDELLRLSLLNADGVVQSGEVARLVMWSGVAAQVVELFQLTRLVLTNGTPSVIAVTRKRAAQIIC
jgi:hypothetical protein